MATTPIDPQDYPYGVNVVDIGDARVSRGRSRREYSSCPHKALNYDIHERRVVCSDCDTELEAFDAFRALVENYDKALKYLKAENEKIKAARENNLVSLASKHVDRVWRGKTVAPACPHCNRGLLPEDFKAGVKMSVSREMERARRNRENEK